MDRPRLALITAFVALAGTCCIMSGCTQSANRPPSDDITSNVDRNLRLVDSGTNKRLKFKADKAGLIRLYDVQKQDYLYSGSLKAGDQFVVEPNSDHAMINKDPAYLEHATNTYDEYRLYFLNQ
jgi:hypothetical protein